MTDQSDRDVVLSQYAIAVEEYRFQVDLNWRRSQYYFALCAAITAASFALYASPSGVPRGIVSLAFVVDASIAVAAIEAAHTQRGYYRSARDHVLALADRADISDLAVRTTPTMSGSRADRFARVTTLQTAVFGMLAALSISAAVVSAIG